MNILVVGGTTGIGKGLALNYLEQEDYRVAITGRKAAALAAIKEKYPDNAVTFVHDVTAGGAENIIAKTDSEMGKIDTIVIVAGIGEINLMLTGDLELRTVSTNVFGFTDYAIAAYNYFKANGGGTLAAISSIASFRGGWAAPAYYASKAYVRNYLEGLRVRSFKEKANVSVCNLIPGYVDTKLGETVGGKKLFWMAPVDKAVKQIAYAIDKKKPHAYITKRWWFVAQAMKAAPYWLYRHF